MRFEDEILDKRIEQKAHLLKSIRIREADLETNDLLKSFSSDLSSRYPDGFWRTINGASVFVNGGKVVAGLGGFNGAIDEYFSKKESGKQVSMSSSDYSDPSEAQKKINSIKEGESILSSGKINGRKMSKEELEGVKRSIESTKKKLSELDSKDKTKDKPKESKETDVKDESMTEKETKVMASYKEDKKGWLKHNAEPIIQRPEKMKYIDELIEGAKNSEYRAILNEVKQYAQDKLDEPEKQKGELKEKMKAISYLLNEDKNAVDYNKLLDGDVTENFKKMNEYDKLYNKVLKENPKNASELGNLTESSMRYDEAIKGKTATVKKKEIKVRETDTENALKSIVTTDPLRPIYNGIFHDPEGYKVASNLHSLIAVKTDIGDNAGKTINPKTKEEIEGKFAVWKSVIPQKTNGEIKMKLSDLHSLTSQAMDINKVEPISVTKIKGVDQDFDPKIINGAVESLRKLGVEDVSVLNGEDGGSRPLIIKGNNKKGEEVTCLIMPMKAVENQHLIITQ